MLHKFKIKNMTSSSYSAEIVILFLYFPVFLHFLSCIFLYLENIFPVFPVFSGPNVVGMPESALLSLRLLLRFYSKISSLAGMAGKPLQNRPILVAKWLEFHVKITIFGWILAAGMCGNPA